MMTAFNKSEIETSVGARLRTLAERLPRKESIRSGAESISYSELDALTDRVARKLLAACGPAPEPVAVLLQQGIPSLIAALGILKSGKSFSILPPLTPRERLDALWRDLLCPPILSDVKHHDLAQALGGDAGLVLDIETASASAGLAELPEVAPDALGAIFYTSASTGEPKGVMWPQRMILHTAWQNGDLYRISPGDRLMHLSAYGFGAATTACLAAILNGATLYLPVEKPRTLWDLLSYLGENRITILSLTSFGLLRQTDIPGKRPGRALPDLRLVLLGGEDLYPADLQIFRGIFRGHTSLSYRLAGSETMLMRENRIDRRTPLPGGKLPVGRAVPDKHLLLLDERHRPVPEGQVGEIAIRTRYLASGYWQKPELYSQSFRAEPGQPGVTTFFSGDLGRLTPDGMLEYLGRTDNVVKIRGFSIRLEDVERGLQTIGGVRECCAASLLLPSGEKRLAAYIVWQPGAAGAVEDVRRELAESLPPYMIPTVFVFPDSLPRTATGKIERARLPSPGTIRPPLKTPLVLPGSELEKSLCEIWKDLLRIDAVGIHDDFFDLGGDSLLALTLSCRIEEGLNRTIPKGFFARPTVATLVELWQNGESHATQDLHIHRMVDGGNRSRIRKHERPLTAPVFYGKPNLKRGDKTPGDPSRLFRIGIAAVSLQLPYRQGSRWAAGFALQPWAKRLFLFPQIELFRRFLRDLGGAPEAPEFALEIFLAGSILWSRFARRRIDPASGPHYIDQLRNSPDRYWNDLAGIIEKGSDETYNRFFSVSGLEHLERPLREKRGVIIATYHNTANRIAMAGLPRRLQCEPITTISIMRVLQLNKYRTRKDPAGLTPADENALLADLTLEGKQLLREGKIIQVVPDSTDDTVGDRPLAIGGRRFHIKPGLAEYALLTGAAIVPQFSTRRLDGSVHTAFQPPIEIPPSVVNREDRVFSILEQYAAFVDRSWRLAPEGLNWKLFEKIFLKPRVSDPPSPPQASGEAHPEPDAAGSSGGIGAPD